MLLEKLSKYKVYLCSQSPRRRELLQQTGISFSVATKIYVDENYPAGLPPEDIAIYLAKKKADAYKQILEENRIAITADTIVVCDGVILGKPKDYHDAERMLKFLSGKKHQVITGVCIFDLEKMQCFSSVTDVWFRPLSDDEITYYIDKFKPFDKAGAYGIQEWIGYVAIEKISGSYYNVVGLPVEKLYTELEKFLDIKP